jgi:hypothetical protein
MNFLGIPIYAAGGGGGGGSTGDVMGPSSSTVNAFARYADVSGKTLKNSSVTMTDNGIIEGLLSIETDFVTGPGSLAVEAASDVMIRAPGSFVEVKSDIVIDTDDVVSITARGTGDPIQLSGNTLLMGKLTMTGAQIKGVGDPSLFDDVATKNYVDTRFKGWAQMIYNSPTGAELFTSATLNNLTFGRLFPSVVAPGPTGYFLSASGDVVTFNGVDFVLQRPGNYRVRYRVGMLATTPLQVMSLIVQINFVNVAETEQYVLVDSVSYKYHEFEFIFTSTVTFNRVSIFAKVSVDTPIKTNYVCFNVTSI